MSRFASTLQSIADRLDLPQPARSRLLLELAADMDDLFDHLCAQGLADDDAHREALRSFELSDAAMIELADVHHRRARRLLDRLSSRSLRLWERGVLLVMVLAAVHAGGWFTRTSLIMRDAGAWAWPVLCLAVLTLVLAARKTYQLCIRQDHHARRLRAGLAPVLGLSVVMMALGFVLPWIDVVLQLRETSSASSPVPVGPIMMQWILRTTALLQGSLGLGLAGAVAWFGLARTVLRIEQHESEVLLTCPRTRPEELPCN